MSNIVNKISQSEKNKELADAFVQYTRTLCAAVLDRPRCGCNKSLCSNCRRAKSETDIAERLLALLNEFEE
jgi:hypothetical protein